MKVAGLVAILQPFEGQDYSIVYHDPSDQGSIEMIEIEQVTIKPGVDGNPGLFILE